MYRYLNKLFAASVLAILLPAYAWAASFFPVSDTDINLTENTTFNFDSYTISSGINVSYTAPENSFVDIFITNDMLVEGTLGFFGGATYSLTFDTGTITGNGSIYIDSGTLQINANNLNIGSGTGSGPDLTASGVTLNGNGGTITGGSMGTGIITIDPVIFTPTPTSTGVILTLQLTPVPVPPSLLLFLTGLITLAFGFKRNSNQ